MSEGEREERGRKAYGDGLEVVEGLEVPALEVARAIHRAHPAVRVEPSALRCFCVRGGYLACKEPTAARALIRSITGGSRRSRDTHASGL